MAQYVSITIAAICTAHAGAQSGGLLVEVSNVITPQTPTATVSIYAQVGAPLPSYGIAGAFFDLFASEHGFADVTYIYQNPPFGGAFLPTNHGNWLEEIKAGQTLPFPTPIQLPYLLLSVEWEASSFEPRTVNLWTDNIFHLSTFYSHHIANPALIPNPINGSATIQIIPAPSSALALFAGASMLGARRRRSITPHTASRRTRPLAACRSHMMAQKIYLCAALLICTTSATADPIACWTLEPDSYEPISPTHWSVSLQLSITYDANAGYYAFAHSDVIANASDSNLIGAFAGYGSNLISHFAFEQLDPNSVLYHCSQPHAAGAPASTENPAWVAEFVWWTTDFTPRTVEISTSTVDFAMYLHQNLPGSQSIPLSSIQDVTITLQVIPAPSSALALFAGAGLLGARRRRRQ